MTTSYRPQHGALHRFKRGDGVTTVSGSYRGCPGVGYSAVFQRTVDYPDEFAPAYYVVLNTGPVITVRRDQVGKHSG